MSSASANSFFNHLIQNNGTVWRAAENPDASLRDSVWPANDIYKRTQQARNCRVDGADFTGSQLQYAQFIGCTFVDCVFDRVDFTGARFWGTRFERCSFDKTILHETGMGGGTDRNAWVDCHFISSDLRTSRHFNEQYTGTRFENCNLSDVDFDGAVFDNCQFVGVINSAQFRGLPLGGSRWRSRRNRMSRVNFETAVVRACAFHDLNLSDVTMPLTEGHVILPDRRALARSALSVAGNEVSKLDALEVFLERQIEESPSSSDSGPGVEFMDELGDSREEATRALDLLAKFGAVLT